MSSTHNHSEQPGDDLPVEYNPDGSRVLRHEGGGELDAPVFLDEAQMERIEAHVKAHLGESPNVLHEILSFGIHVDVLVVPPTEESPFLAIATMGMSAVPMTFDANSFDPDGPQPTPFAELAMVLPGDWPIDVLGKEDATDEEKEEAHWPIGLIKDLARVPINYDTALGAGHTIPNGDPAQPYAPGCPFTGVILLPGDFISEGFGCLEGSEEGAGEGNAAQPPIDWFVVAPLYSEEMDHKLQHGIESLMDRLEAAGIDPLEMADPRRPNSCAE